MATGDIGPKISVHIFVRAIVELVFKRDDAAVISRSISSIEITHSDTIVTIHVYLRVRSFPNLYQLHTQETYTISRIMPRHYGNNLTKRDDFGVFILNRMRRM